MIDLKKLVDNSKALSCIVLRFFKEIKIIKNMACKKKKKSLNEQIPSTFVRLRIVRELTKMMKHHEDQ